ncbi:hypothetical protein SAMN04489735_105919 [Aneurinibacillus thermoaerophilus]|uniref:Uncharacterized protein n=1 Tax=Aneurinibacillus thermoaerophilus TaxID=143495 RepID=A0A1G8F8Y2_ANETH|nr:hypothetical protein SAMN04489735_105919 [Aneurinibacillus thermoaerophilus]
MVPAKGIEPSTP